MENNSPDILTDSFINEGKIPREKLLPLWIKIFAWIFLIVGLLMPIILVLGIIMHSFEPALYGIESNTLYSSAGIFVVVLFIFKAVTAFGLLKHKYWAIKVGITDAIMGIIICCGVMLYEMTQHTQFMFRLELIALIPYLLKLKNMKHSWENSVIN